MRMLNWLIIEVLSGIGLGVTGGLIHNNQMFTLGFAGTMLPLFHNLIGQTFWYEYKLTKENKYAVQVLCKNCQNYTTFRITNGKSVQEHVKGKICGWCNNEFKLQNPNEVKHT